MDLFECDSCQQMISKKNICVLNITDHNLICTITLKQLMAVEKKSFPLNICQSYCYKALQKGEISKFSVLNNMKLNQIPIEISSLNSYELLLIQLAKCFHTIYRLKSIKNYKNGEQMFGFKGK